jgi:predicted MFS family arabinose efflux permease
VVATWFRGKRSRALTVLTFIGGFASVIFVPLATMLVASQGWRAALLLLAAILAVLTVVPHALVLRRRPFDLGLEVDGAFAGSQVCKPADEGKRETGNGKRETGDGKRGDIVLRSARFRWTAVAFTLSALTSTAMTVHLVPLLLERGYGAAFAGSAMGMLGLMALPGRLIFTPLGDRWPRGAVTASIFALQAAAVVVLLTSRGTVGVWTFVALFGAGFGAITPARAALVGELVEPSAYGRVSGTLALIISLARAGAPVGASVLYVAAGGVGGGYDAVLVGLLALCVLSGVAVLAASAPTPSGPKLCDHPTAAAFHPAR